jgi:hypothetical protein
VAAGADEGTEQLEQRAHGLPLRWAVPRVRDGGRESGGSPLSRERAGRFWSLGYEETARSDFGHKDTEAGRGPGQHAAGGGTEPLGRLCRWEGGKAFCIILGHPRHAVKKKLYGLWQLSGRGNRAPPPRVQGLRQRPWMNSLFVQQLLCRASPVLLLPCITPSGTRDLWPVSRPSARAPGSASCCFGLPRRHGSVKRGKHHGRVWRTQR